MQEKVAHWIEFSAILITTGAVILFLFFCVLGVRWHYRKKRMKAVLNELRRDPFMVTHVQETKTMLDCKVGEFRQVVIS